MFFLIFYVKLSNLSVAANQLTKPLASKSDKHLISPHSIIAKSNIKFLRIKDRSDHHFKKLILCCQTNSPLQCHWKYIENGVEKMHIDVKGIGLK